jgi:hypothetical protein
MVKASGFSNEIKEYRKAKTHKGIAIPFDQAFRKIEEAVK